MLIPQIVAGLLHPPPIVPSQPFVPCLIHGRLEGAVPDAPVWLAIAAGGRILATTRTSTDLRFRRTWAAWVDPDLLPSAETKLDVYRIEDWRNRPRLVEIPTQEVVGLLRAWEPDSIFQGDEFE